MKNQLFKILTIIVLFTTLFSCRTAQELVEKAIKKDPNIILCKDSIVETKLPGETITIYGKDSVHIKTNRVDILATYDSLGLKVVYTLKDTTIYSKETTPVIKPSPTNTEIRQKEKTKRKEIKQEGKTDRKQETTKQVEAKSHAKEVKYQERGNWWNLMVVGFMIGAASMYLFMTKILRR